MLLTTYLELHLLYQLSFLINTWVYVYVLSTKILITLDVNEEQLHRNIYYLHFYLYTSHMVTYVGCLLIFSMNTNHAVHYCNHTVHPSKLAASYTVPTLTLYQSLPSMYTFLFSSLVPNQWLIYLTSVTYFNILHCSYCNNQEQLIYFYNMYS